MFCAKKPGIIEIIKEKKKFENKEKKHKY